MSNELVTRDVDPDSDDGERWLTAVVQGFYDGAPPSEQLRLWREHVRTDGMRLRGVYPAASWTSDPLPVATYASWDESVNVGGGRQLTARLVTDVTTAPTHRRRGLLRALITADLADAVSAGVPLAALTVSEGGIYGRFGFGQATRLRSVEVDTRRFALHTPLSDDPGRCELIEARDAWPAIAAVFAQHLATSRGAVGRHAAYEPNLTGVFTFHDRAPDPKRRALLHLDADGEPDGYAVFRHEGWTDGVPPTVTVWDLLATSTEVELRLWRQLADLDLVERLRFGWSPAVSPLDWAVSDPRAVRTTGLRDLVWLRVLDVPAALAARPWAGGDHTPLVLRVLDPLGHADGTWELTVRDGAIDVSESAAEPEVTMDVAALGSLYLGDVGVATLLAAGRLGSTRPEAALRLAAIADVGPPPYCATGF